MPAPYLRVKNWEKFQHYHNRPNAPYWIKMYPDLLMDFEFLKLKESDRYKLMAIWLLASKLRNKIPNDGPYVAKVIGSSKVNLAVLVELGFLEAWDEGIDAGIDPGRVNADAGRTQNRTEEKERKEAEQNRTALPDDLEAFGQELEQRQSAPFGSEDRLFEILSDMDKNSPMVLRPLLAQLSPASVEQARAEVLAGRDVRRPTAYAVEILTSMVEKKRSAA